MPSPQQPAATDTMFAPPPREKGFPLAAIGAAAAAVVILVVILILVARHQAAPPLPTTLQPAAAYASNLTLTGIHMSESGSLSGVKTTYIDGHIANQGSSTITAVTVQVVLANDVNLAPQIQTMSMPVIRSSQPYIDTEPISAAPLAPGAEADFHLILDPVNDNWNQQLPEVRIIQVSTK